MLKFIQLFGLVSFVVMALTTPYANAGYANTSHYSKNAKVVCGKTGCRTRGR